MFTYKNMSDIISKNHIWDYCPVEILETIFSKLDPKSLINCMKVCKRWTPIADHVGERNGQWEQIVDKQMVNRGASFKQKSNPEMRWRDLYFNSQLWLNVRHAILNQYNTYTLKDIKKIEIYRDNLIVICKSSVKYINAENCYIVRDIPISCSDFNETDHIIMKVLPDVITVVTFGEIFQTNRLSKITLYGKCSTTDFDISICSTNINLTVYVYKLHNDCCYVIDSKFALWKFQWANKNMQWDSRCLARHYGICDSVTSINLYRDEVCMMLNWGDIYRVDFETLSFVKDICFEVPRYRTEFTPLMFHFCSVIVGVPEENDLQLKKHEATDHMILECPGLTCAVEHGDVLFLGYSDGRVEVCLPRKMMMNGSLPELEINVPNFNKSESAIVSLNVYEVKNSHFLLIATQTKVHQILLTYADPEKMFVQETRSSL